jgi:hypothetical protein
VRTLKRLPLLDATLVLIIDEADATPFTVEVAMFPPVVKELDEMTEVVATTPFTVLVRTLPVTDWVKELMIDARVELMPFTIVLNRFTEDEATLVLMILDAEAMPFTVEVAMLPLVVKVLVVAPGVSVVVAMTPLIVVVRRLVLVA